MYAPIVNASLKILTKFKQHINSLTSNSKRGTRNKKESRIIQVYEVSNHEIWTQ